MILPDPLRLILAAFAVYRLGNLIAFEDGPFFAFARLRGWTDANRAAEQKCYEDQERDLPKYTLRASLDELANCPYCQGVWWAMVVACLVILRRKWGDWFFVALGLCGIQKILQDKLP